MKQKSKKTAKSIIAGVLSACMLMSGGLSTVGSYITQGIVASAADVTVVESGSCGEEGNNVVYTLDSEGTLIISGSGNMGNSANSSPFYDDSNIKQVIIKDGVTSIGYWAFEDCTGLTSITIPDSVKSIGNGAFLRCTGLTSITIPDSVKSIGNRAFENCRGLTSITIPDSVTSMGNCFSEELISRLSQSL